MLIHTNPHMSIFPCLQNVHICQQLDWKFYLKMYPELIEKGIITKKLAQQHWLKYGKIENRVPNQLEYDKQKKYMRDRIYQENQTIANYTRVCSVTESIKFFVLVRTSMRPALFEKCIQSIESQTYKNFEIMVAYDTDQCVEYINSHPHIIKLNMNTNQYHNMIDHTNYYKFNSYCNILLQHVYDISQTHDICNPVATNNWVVFLDDDDMLAHNGVFACIHHEICKSGFNCNLIHMWNFVQCVNVLEIDTQHPPTLSAKHRGRVASSSYCFNVSHAVKSKWQPVRGGDFDFICTLTNLKNISVNYIPYILTHTSYFAGSSFGITQNNSLNMMHLTQLDPNTLSRIWYNIDCVMNMMCSYDDILFLCSDYPGHGGAATNCSAIQSFVRGREKKTYCVYWNYMNDHESAKLHVIADTYQIIDEVDLEHTLRNRLPFVPKMIVLKSPCHVDLKKHFTCPIVYLIGGIYHTRLNTPLDTLQCKSDHDMFINNDVLVQSRCADIVFCNSSHTQSILKQTYDIDTCLFYSSFVPFYRHPCPARRFSIQSDSNAPYKYDYAIISEDCSKSIKNVSQSVLNIIKFTHPTDKCICIGDNLCPNIQRMVGSKQNWTHLRSMSQIQLLNLYPQIKCVVQDSHFESCSNVKIEALFNGCLVMSSSEIGSTKMPRLI